jgi:hypothetical protein
MDLREGEQLPRGYPQGLGNELNLWRTLLAFLLLASPAAAQTLDVRAGASSLLQADGGSVTAYFPSTRLDLGAGFDGGHFVYGATMRRDWRGWDAALGDVPFQSNGLAFATRGLTMRKQTNTRTIIFFVGAAGDLQSAQYFQATQAHNFGAGFAFTQKFGDALEFSSTEVIHGGRKTVTQTLAYQSRRLQAAGGGGLLENQLYYFGQGAYRPTDALTIGGGHTASIYDGTRFTVDNAGIGARLWLMSFNASAFEGHSALGTSSGQSLGADIRTHSIDAGADFTTSKYGSAVLGHVTEQFRQRFHVSEYATYSGGHLNLAAGGGFTGNTLSVDVSYTTYFQPLFVGRSPFQNAMTLTIGLHAPHDIALNLASYLLPTGKVKFTSYGEGFARGPWAGGAASRPDEGRTGKFEISGLVVDASGQPVQGIAVKVGADEVWSDAQGAFFVRVKNQTSQSVSIVETDFLAPGTWQTLSAPDTAQPGQRLDIRIARLP